MAGGTAALSARALQRLGFASHLVVMAGMLLGIGSGVRPAAALTFTVTSTGDGADADLTDGVCSTMNAGPCTLRAALQQANATAGLDSIAFAIPPLDGSIKTIAPTGPLPAIADPAGTLLDGFTQDDAAPNSSADGMNAVLRIQIDGTGAGDVDGLVISGGHATVRGLIINRFARNGIGIVSNGANHIEGNYIGIDATGLLTRGNAIGVLVLSTAQNTIGGGTPAARNVIGGNNTGVSIDSGTANVVSGNFIGLGADGHTAVANTAYGVLVFASGNTIGGATTADRNVISGNALVGVVVLGAESSGNLVQGNFIGTNALGTAAVPNQIGVDLEGPANTVGGLSATPGAAPGNVISGNTRAIRIPVPGATGNIIEGNLIGTNASGSAVLADDTGDGIEVLSDANQIGGPTAAARNVIAGTANAVRLAASNNVIQSNYIGSDVGGTLPLGNGGTGILLFGSGTTIGGPAPAPGQAPGNVIVANRLSGVFLGAGAHNVVQGNAIGVGADGQTPLANGSHGVSIGEDDTDATIGGEAAGAGNRIAFNHGYGVLAAFDASSHDHHVTANTITGNLLSGVIVQLGRAVAIHRNAISGNGGLGIDLVGGELSGEVTRNDAGDTDSGSNDRQNFPVLAAALPMGTGARITGTLPSAPLTAYTIEIFANDACDPSGFGEGAVLLDVLNVMTGADGLAAIDTTIPFVPPGSFITATATDPAGNTSEFSACAPAAFPTATPTDTFTATPTITKTGTPTVTGTSTATASTSATATRTVTFTPTLPPPTASPTTIATAGHTATPSATVSRTPTPTSTRGPCFGDCNGDHMVAISEVILCVNLDLDSLPVDQCPAIDGNGDNRVTITELVRAVGIALTSCP